MEKWNLEARPFDSISRGLDLCTAIGEVIPDLLAQKTVTTNPYFPTLSTLGTVTNYTIDLEVNGVVQNFTFTSLGTETYSELLNALVLEGNTNFGLDLVWTAFTEYDRDEDMYFTVVTRPDRKITAQPVFGNIEISTQQVQAPNGQPLCQMSMQSFPTGSYPRVIVTPLPITSVDEKFRRGSILHDFGSGNGQRYYPFYDNYVKANYQITVESGGYDKVLNGEVSSAESILRVLRRRIGQDNRGTQFMETIDATINDKWDITPAPVVDQTDWMSIASTIVTLDIIDRWIDEDGDVMTKVIIGSDTVDADLRHKGNPNPEIILNQEIQRTDHVD